MRSCTMLDEQLHKAATGLAMIIPAIFLLRWYLTRKTGSPEKWAEERIKELEQKFAAGDIDEETFNRHVQAIRDS